MVKTTTEWVVETLTTYGWDNTWTDDGEPVTFPDELTARQELRAFLLECWDAGLDYSEDDYRVVRKDS